MYLFLYNIQAMCFEVTYILIGHTIMIWNSSSGLSNSSSQLSHILSPGFIYLILFVNLPVSIFKGPPPLQLCALIPNFGYVFYDAL